MPSVGIYLISHGLIAHMFLIFPPDIFPFQFRVFLQFFPVVLMQASPTHPAVCSHTCSVISRCFCRRHSQHVRGFAHGPPFFFFFAGLLYAERRLNGSVKESSRRVQTKVQAEFNRKGRAGRGGLESEPFCWKTPQISETETEWKHSRW